mgnify:FL=1
MGGIVASEASRKKFDVPNNIIKRLHEKNGGQFAPWPPGSATVCETERAYHKSIRGGRPFATEQVPLIKQN